MNPFLFLVWFFSFTPYFPVLQLLHLANQVQGRTKTAGKLADFFGKGIGVFCDKLMASFTRF